MHGNSNIKFAVISRYNYLAKIHILSSKSGSFKGRLSIKSL